MINAILMAAIMVPQYLYKITTQDNWEKSRTENCLILSTDDDAFIHFSTEDQLDKILAKYWKDAPPHVILKIDTSKLPGDMLFETNPGGSGTKYYHLYNGSIPLQAVTSTL